MADTAVIIDISDPSPTSIIADVELEIARLRRLVGSVWAAREAGQAELANVLLEAHDAISVLDTLAGELRLRMPEVRNGR